MGKEKVIGILGGMGPYTTIDMFRRIVDLTPAQKDWEHLRIIIDNNPKIPSRSRAILFGEASPAPMMIETAKNLEKAGADFIIIPCNTSHHFYVEVQREVSIPILNIIEETRDYMINKMPRLKRVGLLSTLVTARGDLFHNAFAESSIKVMIPGDDEQLKVSEVIEAVKLGNTGAETKSKLVGVANKLVAEGAEALIIGCTELSIVAKEGVFSVPLFNSSQILAQAAVNRAGRQK